MLVDHPQLIKDGLVVSPPIDYLSQYEQSQTTLPELETRDFQKQLQYMYVTHSQLMDQQITL